MFYEGICGRINAAPYPGPAVVSSTNAAPSNTTSVANTISTSAVSGTTTVQAKVLQQPQLNDSTTTTSTPLSPILKAQLSAPAKATFPLRAPSQVGSLQCLYNAFFALVLLARFL